MITFNYYEYKNLKNNEMEKRYIREMEEVWREK